MADNHLDKIRELATIGIITALPKEYAALKLVFGEGHGEWRAPGSGAGRRIQLVRVPNAHGDEHVVAMATLPDMGNNIAAAAATVLLEQVPSIQHVIMCGIAGGVPNTSESEHDVRLGDIVTSDRNGVVQYDLVKENPDASEVHRSPPRPPSSELLEAVHHLEAEEELDRRPWLEWLKSATAPKWTRPADNVGARGEVLDVPVDPERVAGLPRVFRATVASANRLLRNPAHRDAIGKKFGVKAVEMEGSGIADATWLNDRAGYLVIRGIVDYCDPDKGDRWHRPAALVAAAYTRALLTSMHASGPIVRDLKPATSAVRTFASLDAHVGVDTRNARAINTALGWNLGPSELAVTIVDLNETRRLLATLTTRSREFLARVLEMATDPHECAVDPYEVEQRLGLTPEEVIKEVRLLETRGFGRLSPGGFDDPPALVIRAPVDWPVLPNLRDYARATSRPLDDLVVELRFDKLDDS